MDAFSLNIYQYQTQIYYLAGKGGHGRELITDTSGLFILYKAYFALCTFLILDFEKMTFMIGKCSKLLFVYLALGKGETNYKKALVRIATFSFSILPKLSEAWSNTCFLVFKWYKCVKFPLVLPKNFFRTQVLLFTHSH